MKTPNKPSSTRREKQTIHYARKRTGGEGSKESEDSEDSGFMWWELREIFAPWQAVNRAGGGL